VNIKQATSRSMSCGAVACDSDFAIELEQPEAWPLGTYEVFVAVAGGAMESCVIELGGPAVDGAKDFCAAGSFTLAYVTGGRLNRSSNRGIASSRDVALGPAGLHRRPPGWSAQRGLV
jgi:hypothetical protein